MLDIHLSPIVELVSQRETSMNVQRGIGNSGMRRRARTCNQIENLRELVCNLHIQKCFSPDLNDKSTG